MCIFESKIKLVLLAVTSVSLGLTFWLSTVRGNSKYPSTLKVTHAHFRSHILFVVWLAIPYHYIFAIEDFEAEVKQWRADLRVASKTNGNCPQFDSHLWSRFSMGIFISVMLLICILHLSYSQFFRSVNQSMESLYEHQRRIRVKEHSHETGLSTEELTYKKEKRPKRVTFHLPEPRPFREALLRNKCNEMCLMISPSKRQVVLAMSCLGLSMALLSKPFQHAFSLHLVRIEDFTLTSDHIFAAVTLFSGLELARTVSLGFNSPKNTSNIRLAVSSFIEFYGIFLMLLSAMIWFQANDTLKLYIYKIFTHCGNTREWHSFFDVRVPNENFVSAILGENMMKYTNSVLRIDFDENQRTETIDGVIRLFIWVLGDCVTVILFATLVVVPGTLALIWG